MFSKVIQIGNSQGVILPKWMLNEVEYPSFVEINKTNNNLIISPVKNPRKGWKEAAIALHKSGDDKLLFPDIFEDETFEDWTWDEK